MAKRRALHFDDVNQVMPEVDLLLRGYSRGGNWTLAQVCHHLALILQGTVEGWRWRMPWIFRRTVGAIAIRRIFSSGKMPEGIKLNKELKLMPESNLNDRAEAEFLRSALRVYGNSPGPFPEHPYFGLLTRSQWDRLHAIHCAHHLSFLWPEPLARQP
jgi:hypothetical protein